MNGNSSDTTIQVHQQGRKTVWLCSFVANFSQTFCACYAGVSHTTGALLNLLTLMEDNAVLIGCSLIFLIPAIYGFDFHEHIIIKKAYGNAFMKLAIFLALIGACLFVASSFSRFGFFWLFTFVTPLAQLFAFKILYQQFLRTNGHPPRDVYHNFNSGLFNDRVFAFKVTIGFMLVSMGYTIPFIFGLG